jgi:mono/diheme cytochrome c family protein
MEAFATRCSASAVLLFILGAGGSLRAQAPDYSNVGRTPSPEEIRSRDLTIGPEGKELPPGSGTAKVGADIFAEKCASCHGVNGEGGPHGVGGPRIMNGGAIKKGLPYATSLWTFIHNNMPYKQGLTLKPDEVYALTALLLFKNGIIQENAVMDAKSLPQVRMPNRDGFVPAKPDYTPNAPNQKP